MGQSQSSAKAMGPLDSGLATQTAPNGLPEYVLMECELPSKEQTDTESDPSIALAESSVTTRLLVDAHKSATFHGELSCSCSLPGPEMQPAAQYESPLAKKSTPDPPFRPFTHSPSYLEPSAWWKFPWVGMLELHLPFFSF